MLDSSKFCQNSLCLQEEVSLALCLQPPAERDSVPTLDLPHASTRPCSAASEPTLCDITEGCAGTYQAGGINTFPLKG